MTYTAHEHHRARLLRRRGIWYPDVDEKYPGSALWWAEFAWRQAARFLLGLYRYSEPGAPGRPRYDHVGRITAEVERYQRTGHPEALVEIANAATMEYADRGYHRRPWVGTDEGARIGTEVLRGPAS